MMDSRYPLMGSNRRLSVLPGWKRRPSVMCPWCGAEDVWVNNEHGVTACAGCAERWESCGKCGAALKHGACPYCAAVRASTPPSPDTTWWKITEPDPKPADPPKTILPRDEIAAALELLTEQRIGDEERHAAAGKLSRHFEHGRLPKDEFDRRLDHIMAAVSQRQIDKAFKDLPDRVLAPQGRRELALKTDLKNAKYELSQMRGKRRRTALLTGVAGYMSAMTGLIWMANQWPHPTGAQTAAQWIVGAGMVASMMFALWRSK